MRARLTNRARELGRPFQEILQFYGLERFLYRLSLSVYRDQFVLKGALLLRAWRPESFRPTRDIDLLGFVDNTPKRVAAIMNEVCMVEVEQDGLTFDAGSVSARPIKEDAEYAGVRVTLLGRLQRARIPTQIDVGFGDVVYPDALRSSYPTFLEQSAPILRQYPREAVIAEKYQAMVLLGELNSRMKDFYDIWALSEHFEFDGVRLSTAIAKTFERRDTAMQMDPVAWTTHFTEGSRGKEQWAAFLRQTALTNAPATLAFAVSKIKLFLGPVTEAVLGGAKLEQQWVPGGPWAP